jgi:hypothetical protein
MRQTATMKVTTSNDLQRMIPGSVFATRTVDHTEWETETSWEFEWNAPDALSVADYDWLDYDNIDTDVGVGA